MTDLFANQPAPQPPKPRVGLSNALFLADLTGGASSAEIKRNLDAGKYPEIHRPSIKGWVAMVGGSNP